MPTPTQTSAGPALDGYLAYYTEKLWHWLPGIHRERDALTDNPGALRAIVEAMGEESAEVRRALDRIWENHFVELADDEALATLGALVATRMVHVLNRRARRVDVAKTIWYRRRNGTPRVLESLGADITGWLGAHLEARHRLARTVHLLEPAPNRARARAPFTATPRGGWANLRSPRIPALAWTAFEELAHTPDFRQQRGTQGRYNIPRVNLHLHRARAFEINHPTVVQIGPAPNLLANEAWQYSLDPSGRAVALFQVAERPDAGIGEADVAWARQREWQMPKAIERRLLDHAEFEWQLATLAELSGTLLSTSIDLLRSYVGLRLPSLAALLRLIQSFPALVANDILDPLEIVTFLRETMVPDCGRAQIYGPDPVTGGNQALTLAIGADNGATALTREQIKVGNLAAVGKWDLTTVIDAADPTAQLLVDPERGAVISRASALGSPVIAPVLHYGFAGEVGAGSYDRRESLVSVGAVDIDNGVDAVGPIVTTLHTDPIETLVDDKTYQISTNLVDVEDYRLQAANFTRPYLRYTRADSQPGTEWFITAKNKVLPTDLRCLSLDGVWFGLYDPNALAVASPAAFVGGFLTLAGTWDRVEISHCTLDPGGEQIAVDGQTKAIQYVTLKITGYVEELIIDRSIVGPILGPSSGSACSIGKLTIRDSIVVAYDEAAKAIDAPYAELHVERSSIFGQVEVNRLYASDSLFSNPAVVADRQHGCFRFSAGAEAGDWPRPYESHFFTQFEIAWLESIRFGDANFSRLGPLAPLELRTGAENHGEIGVWNHLIEPIKRADLRSKLREFTPFDLQTALIHDN